MWAFQAEEGEEMKLDSSVDDDGGQVSGMAAPQSQAGDVVEDHPPGGTDSLFSRIQACIL